MPTAPQFVPPVIIAIVFLFASVLNIINKKYEHAFTRFLIGSWYTTVTLFSIPSDWRVSIGGTLFTIMAITEVVSFFYRRFIVRKYEEALRPLKEINRDHD